MSKTDYLPRGLHSMFLSKSSLLIDQKRVVKGRLGNWIAVSLMSKGKRLKITSIYRTPSSSLNGVKCSLTQYHRIDGDIKTTTLHRKQMFEEIKRHIKEN